MTPPEAASAWVSFWSVTWNDSSTELEVIRRWFSQRGLELSLQPWGEGGWRAWITAVDSSAGAGEFVDGASELDAAQRARRHHTMRRFRTAVSALGDMAQTEVGQLLIAEVALTKLPLGKRPLARQTMLATGIWMLDSRRRGVARELGGAASDWISIRASERGLARARLADHPALPAARQAADDGLRLLRRTLRGR
jgi:hypothetical protein